MIGLFIRLVLLAAVVFAVVFGITQALRKNAHSEAAKRIQDDIRALKEGLSQGLYSADEYRQLARKVRVDCEREGLEVPDLPHELPQHSDDKQTRE